MSRNGLTDFEWRVSRHCAQQATRMPRVDDGRVLNGMSGCCARRAWRECLEQGRPATTASVQRRTVCVWDRSMDAITPAYDGDIQMIESNGSPALRGRSTASATWSSASSAAEATFAGSPPATISSPITRRYGPARINAPGAARFISPQPSYATIQDSIGRAIFRNISMSRRLFPHQPATVRSYVRQSRNA